MMLCGLKKKLDLYSFKWEDDAAVVGSVNDPSG
jgi:hypothetical protein